MPKKSKRRFTLWQNIKRRKVHKVLTIYAGTAFIILQAVDIIFPRLGFPDWTVSLALYLLIVGAIITVILSWIYDLTPEGIAKTESLNASGSGNDIKKKSGSRQITSNIIIAVLFVIVSLLVFPRLFRNSSPLSGKNQKTIAVLPLTIIGENTEIEYFSSGLVQSLTQKLAKVGNNQNAFSVIPQELLDNTISVSNARKQLGVSIIISGSIQQDADKTRLILNIIDTKNQRLLKSEKMDYFQSGSLMIQDQAISIMIELLGLRMDPVLNEDLRAGGSNSHLANRYYLEGLGKLREAQSTNEIDAPLKLFHQAIETDPQFARAYAGLGEAYWFKYEFTKDIKSADNALFYTNQALELNPQSTNALITLSDIYYYKEDFENALNSVNKAIDIEPENELAYIKLAEIHENNRSYTNAETYYKKAIGLKPNNWYTYFSLAGFYYYRGNYTKAIEQYEKGLAIAPESQMLLNGLASTFYRQNKIDNAITIWEKIIEINPENEIAILNLGTAYYFKGSFNDAAKMYEKAVSITPKEYKYIGFLAEAYHQAGNTVKGEEVDKLVIDYALEHIDITPSAYFDIAMAYARLRKKDSAEYYLIKSDIPEEPDSSSVSYAFNVGEIYLDLGEKQKALQWFESALKREFGWNQITSPAFDEYKDDPEFKAMLDRIGSQPSSN